LKHRDALPLRNQEKTMSVEERQKAKEEKLKHKEEIKK